MKKRAKNNKRKYCLMLERTPLNYFALLFIGLILLQLVPLPGNVIKVISPETFRLYAKAFEKMPSFMTLSLYQYSTKLGLFKFLAYFGIFFLIINWADSRKKIQGIIHALIFVGIFEAMYGICTYLGNYHYVWWYSNIWKGPFAAGTYINRNHLAGLFEIIIPITFGLLIALTDENIHEKKKQPQIAGIRGFLLSFNLENPAQTKKILTIFFLVIMTLGLILTGSRGGIISLSISFIFMGCVLLSRKRYRQYALILFIICSIALIYGLNIGMNEIIQKFDIRRGNEVGRISLAKSSIEIGKFFPIWGTGWGTFIDAYRKYKGPKEEEYEIDHVHNDWIELGVEMGILGFGLVIFSFFFCLGYFFSLWKRRKNSFSVGIGLGGMGAMVSFALHSFTDFNMHIPANALFLSIAVGITLKALTYQTSPKTNTDSGWLSNCKVNIHFPSWARWPLSILFLSIFCYVLIMVTKPYLAEKILPTLPNDTIEKEIPKIGDICTAISYEDRNAKYFYCLASILENEDEPPKQDKTKDNGTGNNELVNYKKEKGLRYITSLLQKKKSREKKEKMGVNYLISLALKRAILLSPTDPDYHLQLAWRMVRLGSQSQDLDQLKHFINAAEKEFDRALFFMPESAKVTFYAGCFWLWKSKVLEDEDICLQAYDLFTHYLQKAYQLNQGYKRQIQQILYQYYPTDSVNELLDSIFINCT